MPRIHCALGVRLAEMLLRLQAHRRGIAAGCDGGTADRNLVLLRHVVLR
jgi:hypothetical protein